MPLHILLVLVVGGIAGIALTLHMLGLSQRKKLDRDDLHAEWLRHFPDDTFQRPGRRADMVNGAGTVALVFSDQGDGVIWSMGADTTARRLLGAHWSDHANGVSFRFPDPGAPRVCAQLAPQEQAEWVETLRTYHGH